MPSWQRLTIERRHEIVRAIVYTEEQCFDCSDTLQLLSVYIDRELHGGDASVDLPDLAAHLIRCRHCDQVHEALLEIAAFEEQGELPDLSHLWNELARVVRDGNRG